MVDENADPDLADEPIYAKERQFHTAGRAIVTDPLPWHIRRHFEEEPCDDLLRQCGVG